MAAPLSFRSQLDNVVAAELDQFFTRTIKATLSRVDTAALTDGVAWTKVAYNANHFRTLFDPTVAAWTVEQADHTAFKYRVLGDMMWMQVRLDNTSLTGAGNTTLEVLVPGGYVGIEDSVPVGFVEWQDSGGVATSTTATSATPKAAIGVVRVGPAGVALRLTRNDPTSAPVPGVVWNPGANTFSLGFSACFQIKT